MEAVLILDMWQSGCSLSVDVLRSLNLFVIAEQKSRVIGLKPRCWRHAEALRVRCVVEGGAFKFHQGILLTIGERDICFFSFTDIYASSCKQKVPAFAQTH